MAAVNSVFYVGALISCVMISACGGGNVDTNDRSSSIQSQPTSSIRTASSNAINLSSTTASSLSNSVALSSQPRMSSVTPVPSTSRAASSRSSSTPTVTACNNLGAAGEFQEITPDKVKAGFGVLPDYCVFTIAVDPNISGTLYIGTCAQSVWKSTDCGATWLELDKGRNGADVAKGLNWTLAVDPNNSEIVYTNSGYGANGLYKSVNGGTDWDEIWPPASQPELAKSFTYNFVNVIDIDPYNTQHLLLTFHEICLRPNTETCIAESFDGGATWRLLDGAPGWNGNEGQVIFFLENSSTWLWGSQNNGFYRTNNSGASWTQIPDMTTSHYQGSQLLRTQTGTYYMAGKDGIWKSPEGASAQSNGAPVWTLIPNTGPIGGGLVTNGTDMFYSTCFFKDYCNPRYLRSAETDGVNWTQMNSPVLNMGGTMSFDRGNNLLYTTGGGLLWRVLVD